MKKRLYPALTFFVLVVAGIAWCLSDYYSESNLEAPATIVIPPGTHTTEIVDILAQQNIINHPLVFKVILFGSGKSSRIKAGEYAFAAHISAHEAAALLVSGKTVIHQLTVAEGLMTSEIIRLVQENPLLEGEITLHVREGELLPETYHFSRLDKRNDLVQRMRQAMQKTLEEAWAGRADHLPFATAGEALTLASIVEKETGIASERARVAAVYINRLRKGMLLQADPTTAYAVTKGKEKLARALTTRDLMLDSPYNTYRVAGLPPAPIANPGKASLLATLHPEPSDELYFVATGSGGHNFARTLEEHNENVRRYRETRNAAQH